MKENATRAMKDLVHNAKQTHTKSLLESSEFQVRCAIHMIPPIQDSHAMHTLNFMLCPTTNLTPLISSLLRLETGYLGVELH